MRGGAKFRLNIGSGNTQIEGFDNLDRQKGDEAYPLSFGSGLVDEIRASHILEHFPFAQVPAVLDDWVRVLKPGARIRISVPDIDKILKMREDDGDPKWPFYLMGAQTDENDHHKSVFTESELATLMSNAGIENVHHWESDGLDTSCHPVSLNLEGVKRNGVLAQPEPVAEEELPADGNAIVTEMTHGQPNVKCPPMGAVMSVPRLGFMDNMFCAIEVLNASGVNIVKHTGAYWEQCIERVIEQVIDEYGAQWVITVDYDTVFTKDTFHKLCYLLATHPEADAIAPIQMKREGDIPMMWGDEDSIHGKTAYKVPVSSLKKDLFRVKHAHFGLTILRARAFKKLKHPWFHGQPGPDGKWGEGRQDADIYFWEQWAKAGNTLYLATHVPIGHLQLVATWPDAMLRPIQQYVNDFQQGGPPEGVRT